MEQDLPANQWQGLLTELTQILDECATKDSSKLLEIEANIKGLMEGDVQDKRIFLMLAAVFSGGAASSLSGFASSPSGPT